MPIEPTKTTPTGPASAQPPTPPSAIPRKGHPPGNLTEERLARHDQLFIQSLKQGILADQARRKALGIPE